MTPRARAIKLSTDICVHDPALLAVDCVLCVAEAIATAAGEERQRWAKRARELSQEAALQSKDAPKDTAVQDAFDGAVIWLTGLAEEMEGGST